MYTKPAPRYTAQEDGPLLGANGFVVLLKPKSPFEPSSRPLLAAYRGSVSDFAAALNRLRHCAACGSNFFAPKTPARYEQPVVPALNSPLPARDPATRSDGAPAARPARNGNGYNLQNMVGASLRHARRIIVLVIGLTVLALGAALIVLPGPAFVVIPVGLAILATEFEWARRWLHQIKAGARTLVDRNRHPLRNWRRWFRVSR